MRQTDYGTVSCWYERDLLAKIDRELGQHKPLHYKYSKVSHQDKLRYNRQYIILLESQQWLSFLMQK